MIPNCQRLPRSAHATALPMPSFRPLRPLGIVAALAMLVATAPVLAQTDGDFLAARAAYDKGDRAKLAAVAARLERHVLAPYVAYWQFKLGLDDASPIAVRNFVDRYPDTPLADRLRTDWLKSLARKGLWDRFAADYGPPSGDDLELACFTVLYKWRRDGDAALAEAIPLWASGAATPEACEPAFAALFANGTLTSADRRARLRLASETNNVRFAQALGNGLPGAERLSDRDFRDITKDPVAALAKGNFAWKSASGRELALYALERAARADPAAARAPWVKWRDKLPEADRRYGNARLAFHAARRLDPAANDYFREAGDVKLPAEVQAWRVRAALRAQAWDDVRDAVAAMPAAQQQESAWRYWRGRALVADGGIEEGRTLLASLAAEPNFYGILAAEALGQPFAAPLSRPLAPSADELAAFGARPAVQRVVKLAQLDMRAESVREWYYVVRGLADDELLLAAEYARRVGLYDRAINTAERTQARHDFALRYLAPYRDEFDAAARANAVDVALLYGIARQESRFNVDIVSSAGAVGLMQLMPGTARWVAKQMGQGDYRPGRIGEAQLNTQFGAFYFKYWLDRLDGMPALAAAAYNAGPGRAQAWRPAAPLEGAIWVETIPFNETRDYVKKVLANAQLYGHAFNTTAKPLTATLGTIMPRGATVASVSPSMAQ
ncbi:MAG: lytic transglycosylase domain-containing protein [Burkholderiales bacterium]|nr:lytic transglycosylase domain-containing protein [Burkholderiales bacterium]